MYIKTYLEPAEIFDKLSILEVKLFNIKGKGNIELESTICCQIREINNEIANIHALTKGYGFLTGCFPNGIDIRLIDYEV